MIIDESLTDADIDKLNAYIDTSNAQSPNSVSLEFRPHFVGNPGGIENGIQGIRARVNVHKKEHPNKHFDVNPIFPIDLIEVGQLKLWGSDEGFCALLTGFVRALRPEIVLEIGTHYGRTAHALAEGLVANETGHLFTVDMVDFEIHESGALSEAEKLYVTQIIGKTPDVYESDELRALQGIELAFLDGGHTQKEVIEDLEFVEAHRANSCIVLIDNARDSQWPEIQEMFTTYTDRPNLLLDTMCGCQILRLETNEE